MPYHDIHDIVPNTDRALTFTVQDVPSGQTVTNAVLRVVESIGGTLVFSKSITTVAGASGSISNSGTTATLIFQLTAANTALLDPDYAYYLYSVQITTSAGNDDYPVPAGKLNVLHTA